MTGQTMLNVVGQPVPRRDGLAHVTGKTVYVDDITFPDMLHLKMVRCPVPHAHLKGLDFSEAEKVPGFVRILTYKDVPKNFYTMGSGLGIAEDEVVLVEDKALYKGEAIAAVIAETEAAATEAVAAVKLSLEELPAVFDVEEALKPDAPVLKPWGANCYMYEGHPCRRVRFGDVEKGLAEADYIVEGRYDTSPMEHAATEPMACVAKPEADGRYTVYTNTQALFFNLDVTASIVGLPTSRLHFIGGTVGGGFGGKNDPVVEPMATLAAMKTGRPVKYRFTREEEMRVSSTRSGWRIYYKDGVMQDGRIIARQITSYCDSGAYNRLSPYGVTKHASNLAGPYSIPHVWIDAYCVFTNRQPSSSMRGFGVTMASFAVEVQMDRIAETVGMDPWEIRFINAYRNGDMKPHRKLVEDATLIETMQAAARLAGHELPGRLLAMNSWDRQGGQNG